MEIKSLRNFTEKVKGCFVLFLTMMALLAPARMWGQETITIGEGTTTYYNYPINMYYNYSLTEQIYTADEIGFAGTINSISFYYDYTNSFSMSNVTIYMKNVTRDSFASNTDMEPLSTDDIVWNGTFAASGAGWMTINLSTPFEYDGTNNLMVAAYDGTSGYPGSNYKFRTTTCTGNKAILWYSDSYCPAPYNTGSGYSGNKTVNSYRNNIQINITPSSNPKPQGLAASNVTAHGATLSWTAPNEDVIGYAYQYQPAGGEWTALVSTIETSVTLSSLTSDTDYDFQVKAIYADDESNFATTTFHTEVSCPVPTNLQVAPLQTGATTASLSWTESGSATNWVLEYGIAEDFSNATSVNVSGTASHTLTDLTLETRYYARVKADCGGGDQSQWSNMITFKPSNCINVNIGTQSSTTYYYPVNTSYNYSLTQQIYTAEEIGTEGSIHSISFYYNYTEPLSLPGIKLFLKSVTRSSFTSNTDKESLTTTDLVWTGTLSATGAGWVTIDLATPFEYDGVSNLLVCVLDETNGYPGSSYNFRCTSCSGYKCLYWYNNNYIPDPYSSSYSGSKSRDTYRNDIQIGIQPATCPRPVNLQAELTIGDATVATLNWTERGTASNWVLQYGTDSGFATGTYTEKTTGFVANGSSITADLTGLTPETKYYARVKADCGGGDQSAWSNTVEFRPTNCIFVTIGQETNTTSAYPVYMNSSYSLSQQIYKPEEIGYEGLIQSISFYYNYTSPFSLADIKLYMKNVARNGFVQANYYDMEYVTTADLVWSGTLSATGAGWVTIDFDTPFAYDGVSNLLVTVCDQGSESYNSSYVFLCTNCDEYLCTYKYSSSLIDPYAGQYVSNLVKYRSNIQLGILPESYPRPYNLEATLSPSDATVASLSWTEKGTATSWVLQYGTDKGFAAGTYTQKTTGFVVNGTTITYDLTGLTPETRYYARVKANYGNGNESAWSKTVDFKPTNCNYVTIGTDTYNSSNYIPVTTNYNYSLSQQIYRASEIGTEGLIRSISFYYYSFYELNMPNIKLFLKNVSRNSFANSYDMEPMTEDDLVWTGTLSATEKGWVNIDLPAPFAYDGVSNLLVCVCDETNGKLDASYVFLNTSSGDYTCSYWYNDSNVPNPYNPSSLACTRTAYRNNIQIGIEPLAYPKPTNLQATLNETDATVATLTWTENGSATNWTLQYGTDPEFATGTYTEMSTGFTVDGTTVTANFTSLTPETRYYARVKAIYGSGNESGWSGTMAFRPTNCNIVNTTPSGSSYNNTSALPVNFGYNYSLTQQIYTTDEIGEEGLIYTISFYYNSTYSFSMPNVRMFMKNVTRSVFASGSDAEPMTEDDLVWEGTLSATGSGWVTIYLDEPFLYDGESNLLVGFWDGTSGKYNTSDYKFYSYFCTGSKYRTLYWYSDSYIPDPYNTNSYSGSKSYWYYRNNIQLNILPTTTPRPKELAASIQARSATLSWTAPAENVTEYQWQYKAAGDEEWSTLTPTSDLSVTLTELTPETDYTFQVKAVYADGESAFNSKDFTTIPSCLAVTTSYSDLTAHSVTINWTLQDETQNNFDLYYTNNGTDYPNSPTPYGTLVEGITTNSYQLELIPEAPYYVFVRANCGSYDGYSEWSSSLYFAAATACFVPGTPTVSNVTTATADIAWTPNSSGSETAWQVSYNTISSDPANGTIVDVVDNPLVTLQGLDENTTYYVYVRANCGDYDGMSNWSSYSSFTTQQVPVTVDIDHPYSDGFEFGNHWAFVHAFYENYNVWMIGSLTSYLSPKSMYIGYMANNQSYNSYVNNTCYAYATKRFHLAPGTYEVSYDWKCNGQQNYDYCRVALVPDDVTITANSTLSYNGTSFTYSSVPSEFIVLDNGSQLQGQTSWQNQYNEITITEEADYKVVFYWRNNAYSNYNPPIAIDNFVFNMKVGDVPTDLAVSDITPRTANLSWTENGTATAWQVKYANYIGEPYVESYGTVVDATTTSLALQDLRPETYYCVYVRACYTVDGETHYTRWSNYQSFWTDISCYPVDDLEITSLGATTATIGWDIDAQQPSANAPSSWEVRYMKAPLTPFGFEDGMLPDDCYMYNDNGWTVMNDATEAHTGSYYMQSVYGQYDYIDIPVYFGGTASFWAKSLYEYSQDVYVYAVTANGNTEQIGYLSAPSGQYQQCSVGLSDYEGEGYLRLMVYGTVAFDDLMLNVPEVNVTPVTYAFNESGDINDYVDDYYGWSLDTNEACLVSDANFEEAWVEFAVQLGGSISFDAKCLGIEDGETETYQIYLWYKVSDGWDVVEFPIVVSNQYQTFTQSFGAYSGYGYFGFSADSQPSLVIDNLSFDLYGSIWTYETVNTPSLTLTGLQSLGVYYAEVKANCGEDDYSQTESITFMPAMCEVEDQCAITYELYSSTNDAWDYYGASIRIIHHNTGVTIGSFTMDTEGSEAGSLSLCDGETYDLVFNYYTPKSSNPIDFAFYAPDGYLIADFAHLSEMEELTVQFTMECNACHLPNNLAVSDLLPESALVTWTQGDAETTYNVRYRNAGHGTPSFVQDFSTLTEGLPQGWLYAGYDDDEEGYVVGTNNTWSPYIEGEYHALYGSGDGFLLIPVTDVATVDLDINSLDDWGDKQNRSVYFSAGVYTGEISTGTVLNSDLAHPLVQTNSYGNVSYELNLEEYADNTGGFSGYVFVIPQDGDMYIDKVAAYHPAQWTTFNNYAQTSMSLSDLETNVTYEVQVQSICDADDVSRWATTEFTTPICDPENQCTVHFILEDSYDDGWEDAYISVVHKNSDMEIARFTVTNNNSPLQGSLALCVGELYDFIYTPGTCCNGEKSFAFYNHLDELIFGCEEGEAPQVQTIMYTYEVSCSNCYGPTAVDYDAEDTEATIYWSLDEDEPQTAWEIQYSTDQTNWTSVQVVSQEPVDEMSYTLENLNPSTMYYVRLRSNCGNEEYSMWRSISFRTECAEFQTVPYYEDFQAYSSNYLDLPLCWDRINTATDDFNKGYPRVNDYDYAGSMVLKFYFGYSDARNETAILPRMENISGLQMSFDGQRREPYSNYQGEMHPIVIGVYDDSDVFHTIASIDFNIEGFSHHTITFEDYDGADDVGRIAIFIDCERYGWSEYWLWVDNIAVEPRGAGLVAGWNWWAPTAETTVADLTTALGENLLHVMAETDELTSGDLVPGQMYRLQVEADCTLPAVSTPATSAQVYLAPGAHWFGFIGSETSVTDAFADFGPVAGDKVISQNEGFAIYNGTEWVGTLTTLVPGKGYVYVSQATESKTLNLGQ